MAVYYSFSSFSRPETGSGFWSSARLPGPPPPRIMKWQTGPLYNRSGVEPVRLHTVYAFNRPLLPAGLEPGTSPTIPSRQDLPAPSYSPPSTCRQARRFPCMSWYRLVWSSNIISIVRAQIRPLQANVDDKSTYPSCFILPCSMGLQNYATSSSWQKTYSRSGN